MLLCDELPLPQPVSSTGGQVPLGVGGRADAIDVEVLVIVNGCWIVVLLHMDAVRVIVMGAGARVVVMTAPGRKAAEAGKQAKRKFELEADILSVTTSPPVKVRVVT